MSAQDTVAKAGEDEEKEEENRLIQDLLEVHFQKILTTYRATQAHAKLKAFFEDVISKAENESKIDRCICVALGSMSWGWLSSESCSLKPDECGSHGKPMSQFAVFQEWMAPIKAKIPDIPIYFQDPAFGEHDIRFIQSKGYKFVDGTAAFGLLTKETLLFAPISWMDLAIDLLTVKQPAMYLGYPMDFIKAYSVQFKGWGGRYYEEFDPEPYLARSNRRMPKMDELNHEGCTGIESALLDWMQMMAINYAGSIEQTWEEMLHF